MTAQEAVERLLDGADLLHVGGAVWMLALVTDAMIDALGLPAVVPNDICRAALAVARDLVPADVVEHLNHALAEPSSIKVAGGIATPTRFAPPAAGKTPNDAFATLGVALGLIGALERRAAGS